jgi:hypothetical protein
MIIIGIKRFISRLCGLIGVRRLKFKKGKQISLGSILEKQAGKHPDKTLILFENQKISYREFNQRANQVAHLFSSMNFKKGDTVAMLISNRPQFLIIHAGLAKLGIITALINTHIKESALVHALDTARAKSLIVGHECIEEVIKIQDKLEGVAPPTYYCSRNTQMTEEKSWNENKVLQYSNIELGDPGYIFLEKEDLDMEIPCGILDLSRLLPGQPMDNPVVTPAVTTCDTLEYILNTSTLPALPVFPKPPPSPITNGCKSAWEPGDCAWGQYRQTWFIAASPYTTTAVLTWPGQLPWSMVGQWPSGASFLPVISGMTPGNSAVPFLSMWVNYAGTYTISLLSPMTGITRCSTFLEQGFEEIIGWSSRRDSI